jgi:hypothetical protein
VGAVFVIPFFSFRRNWKFCKQCGFFGKEDQMREKHWKVEHPELPLEEFGFLSLGGMPNTCVEAHKSHYKKLVDESNMLNMPQKPLQRSTRASSARMSVCKAKTRRSLAPTTKANKKQSRAKACP